MSWLTAPFGTSKNPSGRCILGVINFLMQMIEFVAKTVSHGMRLFGNMYAGELVFMLIALMGGALVAVGYRCRPGSSATSSPARCGPCSTS